jgi:glycosyltransferase involved in cell wall biosynthesis
MTAYNSESYIAEAIESVLNQTFFNFEFVIIDDASTDGTWPIIQRFAAQDSRIVVFKNKFNLGIPANRNKLVSLAKGKYLAWQDADDVSRPRRLEKQYQLMLSSPKVGICGGWLEFFADGKVISVRKYQALDSELRKKIFRYSPVAQPAAMITREVFVKIGLYNEQLPVAEDLELAFRIGQFYQFANLSEVILKYRQQKNSITYQKLKNLELNTLKIRRQFLDNQAYHFSGFDFLYNFFQWLTLYLLPARFRVAIFNLFRNKN